jgi:hypothetical protein
MDKRSSVCLNCVKTLVYQQKVSITNKRSSLLLNIVEQQNFLPVDIFSQT